MKPLLMQLALRVRSLSGRFVATILLQVGLSDKCESCYLA